MLEKIETLIAAELEAIKNIPINGSIEQAVALIFNHVHEKKAKVVISGVGKAGHIGINIATTLSSTGTPAIFMHPCEAQHGDLGMIQENDVLFLISNSGKTKEILDMEIWLKNLHPNIPIIALCGHANVPLEEIAEVFIYSGSPKEICPLGLTPTTSTTVMTVVGDVLVVLLMEKIKFSKEDYAKRHHGGYLGRKARNNDTI